MLELKTVNLKRSKVNLTAFLGKTQISVNELKNLRPGDLIQVDKEATDELILQIEGRNKFAGVPGQLRGRRAIRLTRPAAIDEPL